MPLAPKTSLAFVIGGLLALLASGASIAIPSGISMAEIEGRWSAKGEGEKIVLDLMRCGERFCGQYVEAGGQCGRTVLTLDLATAESSERRDGVRLSGKLNLDGETGAPRTGGERYVSASFLHGKEHGVLLVELWWQNPAVLRRGMPIRVTLVKGGEADCKPAPAS
ncbi:MAG: hypothetical protein ACLPPF_20600 [Rhodomicrobium sp.]